MDFSDHEFNMDQNELIYQNDFVEQNEFIDQEEELGVPVNYEDVIENEEEQANINEIDIKDIIYNRIYPESETPLNKAEFYNLVKEREGVRRLYNFETPGECFKLFFTEDLIRKIVKYTNIAIRKYKQSIKEVDETEIYAFIGLLFIIGSFKDSTIRTTRLWSKDHGRKIYNGCMARSRFLEILTFLTFDDINRVNRNGKQDDKYPKISELLEELNSKCIEVFSPSPFLVVDETLSLFRGRCAQFMTYLPSKPGKYGLLLRTCADSVNRYLCSFELYAGKTEKNASTNIVMKLVKPFYNSGRNITVDRFYTSINLAIELLRKGLSIVGTARSNRIGIPEEARSIFIDPSKESSIATISNVAERNRQRKANTRELYDSKFFISTNINRFKILIQSYLNKAKNVLIFISTMHSKPAVSYAITHSNAQVQNKKLKSDVNLFYNETKQGVDTLDMMARTFTCKRGTNRWTISLFFTVLDLIGINVNTCCKFRSVGQTTHRDDFLFNLGIELVAPYLSKHRFVPGTDNYSLEAMNLVLVCDNKNRKDKWPLLVRSDINKLQSAPSNKSRRETCFFCDELISSSNAPYKDKKNRSTFNRRCFFNDCKKIICKDHSVALEYNLAKCFGCKDRELDL